MLREWTKKVVIANIKKIWYFEGQKIYRLLLMLKYFDLQLWLIFFIIYQIQQLLSFLNYGHTLLVLLLK